MFLFFVFVSFLISLVFLGIIHLFSFYCLKEEESSSAFECGFIPILDSRVSFSVQFFLFALVFLVFDVEVSLLLPGPLMFTGSYYSFFSVVGFLFVLILGLFYEWYNGAFDWVS